MKKFLALLALLMLASLALNACGPNAEAAIATSVAMTVQAQNALASATSQAEPSATLPAEVNVIPTLTNIFTPIPPTNPPASSGSFAGCGKASLVGETVPDGTIIKPEATFYKSWTIKNESNCTWDSRYKIVFWDGNTLGGAYNYPLPIVTGPGQSIEIPLQLIAPKEEGTYKSEWKLQTPDGVNFGVGQYSEPFYTEVVVKTATDDGDVKITSVTYRLVREPAAGCATNVVYTVYATITVNGPIEVRVQWHHSDGYNSSKIRLTFTQAGSQEIKDVWGIHLGASPGDKWIQLTQEDPGKVEFDKVPFSYLCQ